jgi:hypothetical protein
MGLFDNFGQVASAGNSNPYIVPGRYLLSVDRLAVGVSEQGKGEYFAAEFTVVESDVAERPAGSRVSWALYPNSSAMAPRNIKSLMKALLEEPDDSRITGEVMRKATEGDGTALAGAKVRVSAHEITTRAGNPFTKINWLPSETGAEADSEIPF